MNLRLNVGLLVVMYVLCLGKNCGAQHMNAPDSPCQNMSSASDETACFVRVAVAKDKELNRIYGVVLTVVSGEETRKLDASQRLWIRFLAVTCRAEQELYRGGSAAPMVYFACLEAVTRNRSAELKTMYGWRVEKRDRKFSR